MLRLERELQRRHSRTIIVLLLTDFLGVKRQRVLLHFVYQRQRSKQLQLAVAEVAAVLGLARRTLNAMINRTSGHLRLLNETTECLARIRNEVRRALEGSR